MLHLHNGDCSADVGRRSGLPGEHMAWREALSHGPAPRDLSLDEWVRVRAAHLAGANGEEREACAAGLREQELALARAAEHDEVVIWVEHDLLCQLTLAYFCAAFAGRVPRPARIGLVCAGEFPGVENFRGLGQLSPGQMASLFDSRAELTARELGLGAAVWRAYCSPDPRALERALEDEGVEALAFFALALRAHLGRFPAAGDGLGRVERIALELLAGGEKEFGPLFAAFGDAAPEYGFGDAQFLDELRRLSGARVPFVEERASSVEERRDAGAAGAAGPEAVAPGAAVRFALTEAGRAALDGAADFVALNGIDLWLGGVHLRDGAPLWRRDPATGALVQEPATGA